MTFRNLKEWKKIEVVFDLENEVWMVGLLDFWIVGSVLRAFSPWILQERGLSGNGVC